MIRNTPDSIQNPKDGFNISIFMVPAHTGVNIHEMADEIMLTSWYIQINQRREQKLKKEMAEKLGWRIEDGS